MKESLNDINDKNLSSVIGNIMRWGVLISLSVTFLGGIIYLGKHGNHTVDYSTFILEKYTITEILQNVFSGVLKFDGLSVAPLGILLLFATPVVRIIFSLLGFIAERDWLYVGITLIVLAIIFISIKGGFAH